MAEKKVTQFRPIKKRHRKPEAEKLLNLKSPADCPVCGTVVLREQVDLSVLQNPPTTEELRTQGFDPNTPFKLRRGGRNSVWGKGGIDETAEAERVARAFDAFRAQNPHEPDPLRAAQKVVDLIYTLIGQDRIADALTLQQYFIYMTHACELQAKKDFFGNGGAHGR